LFIIASLESLFMEIDDMDLFRNTLVGAALFVSGVVTSQAAGTVTSTVNFVQVNSNQRAYIMFTTSPTGRPSCATDPRMTIDLNTDPGKAMYNMALTAKASGKRLYAAGTSSCVSKFEKINYMRLL
jgi:hypothetical protein